jgi:hypothetical protein
MKINHKDKDIIVEITEEDYQEQLADGVEDEFLLKPGRHTFRRGGFLERHPDFKPGETHEVIVNITLPLDLEVVKYFERRTAELKADSLKTLMADALREAMKQAPQNGARQTADYSALLNDGQFIAAVAKRVKAASVAKKSPARKRKRPAKSGARAKAA